MEFPARFSIHRTPANKQMKMIGHETRQYQDGPCWDNSDSSSPRSRPQRNAGAEILLSEAQF